MNGRQHRAHCPIKTHDHRITHDGVADIELDALFDGRDGTHVFSREPVARGDAQPALGRVLRSARKHGKLRWALVRPLLRVVTRVQLDLHRAHLRTRINLTLIGCNE
jgi:hypothetical protein